MIVTDATFRFRFWCGPTQVEEIAERLNGRNGFTAKAGTEHVYGYVRMLDSDWPSQEFAIVAKATLGFDPGLTELVKISN